MLTSSKLSARAWERGNALAAYVAGYQPEQAAWDEAANVWRDMKPGARLAYRAARYAALQARTLALDVRPVSSDLASLRKRAGF